jgi:hypothetical protein
MKYSKPEWDKVRFGQICTASENFMHWKSTIEKFCSETDRCTYEEKEQLNKVFTELRAFDAKATLWRASLP